MIIDKRIINGKQEFLFQCEGIGCEFFEWQTGIKSIRGTRKYCSRSCIQKGRHRSDEWKKKMSELISGEGNPFYGKKHDVETRQKMSESAKIGLSQMSPEKRKLMNEHRSDTLKGEKNPFYGKTHDYKTRSQMSYSRATGIAEGRISSPRGLKGWHSSHKSGERFYHDSFYEAIRMRMLDEMPEVDLWTKRHGIIIPYKFMGADKYYVPDFLIEYSDGHTVLEEIKGYENPEKLAVKMIAFTEYCKNHNFECRFIDAVSLERLTFTFYAKKISQLRREFRKRIINATT